MSAETAADGSLVLRGVADGSYILICRQANGSGKSSAVLRVAEVANGATVDLGTLVVTQPSAAESKPLSVEEAAER